MTEHFFSNRRRIYSGDTGSCTEVVRRVAAMYKISKDDVLRGVRGKENEARKMAMYLLKRCCDRTLAEIAECFGTDGYATVSWNCRVVESKMTKEMKFKDRIEKIAARINQL